MRVLPFMPIAAAVLVGATPPQSQPAKTPAKNSAAKPAPAAMPDKKADDADDKKDPRAQVRFPQSVRVGDLPNRDLLEPDEQQHVLGRVRGVVRDKNGDLSFVVRIGGLLRPFGIGTRDVAVPADSVALLGQYVALMDVEPDDLRALPTFASGSAKWLGAGEVIKLGIVKPFH